MPTTEQLPSAGTYTSHYEVLQDTAPAAHQSQSATHCQPTPAYLQRSTEDTIAIAIHTALIHLKHQGSYVRMHNLPMTRTTLPLLSAPQHTDVHTHA